MPRPRRKAQTQPESWQWPNAFKNPEEMQLLLSRQGWQDLMKDCQEMHQSLCHRLVHNVPSTREADTSQAFDRGMIAALEKFIYLEQDLKAWRENQ